MDGTNAFGWTALHWAGKGGHAAAAHLLIQKGANVKASNVTPNTRIATHLHHSYALGVR